MNWWFILYLQHALGSSNVPVYYQVTDSTFFAQRRVQQPIALSRPDTLLLDAALFHATNEVRRRAGVAPCRYDAMLYSAARAHAESMIRNEFYNHNDYTNPLQKTVGQRVSLRTQRFAEVSENIGQYQTIDTADWFAIRRDPKTSRFDFVDIDSKRPFAPYTYLTYARFAVQQWLNSPHHRLNLLNPAHTHVACAARLSAQPYQTRCIPFARLVQNFGSEKPAPPIVIAVPSAAVPKR